ncbi:hypothetical protein AB0L53_42385 [Nonomuraea sp. NPDC052129]|uniref:hypothetical protein n=1 Tax=Nonomuraea sp. NPDC052129 TaxID=3154651 RepID=UPI00341B358E
MDMKLEGVVLPISDANRAKNFYTALDAIGVFCHAGTDARVPGPDPQRRSQGSFLSFSDPDGNGK